MRIAIRCLMVTLVVGTFCTPKVWADISAIEQRLNQLEQEVATLKEQLALEKEEKAKKASESPVVTASLKDGFSLKSPDESFKLKLRGVIQADGRFFTDNQKDNSTTDTFTVRRARPIFEGTVGNMYDFYLMPEFGNGSASLIDGYAEFKLSPQMKIRGGKFKAPFGLERLQADPVANFIEIGLPSNLAPNREIGFQLSGDVINGTLNYALGVFNGSSDGASPTNQDADTNSDKDIVARLFALPFKNQGPVFIKALGFGIAGSYGHKEGSSTPTYKSPGQANIFSYSSTTADGEHIRVSPQAYFYNGPLGIIGEYVVSNQKVTRGSTMIRDRFTNKAWQLTGNYVLTGEAASYKGITPRTNFNLYKGTWGAFEVVGRYEHLNIDNSIFDNGFASLNSSVTQADAWGTGLNWYPHKNIRMSLDFEQTVFKGGASAGSDRKTENAVLSRFQLTY